MYNNYIPLLCLSRGGKKGFLIPATRIYLVEDHAGLQYILSKWINNLPGLTICGVASTGQQVLEDIPKLKPDLVLVDILLPDMSGLDVVNQLYMQYPELLALMHSSHSDLAFVNHALSIGARGYLIKGNPGEIEIAIRQVLNGKIYLSPQLRNNQGLTPSNT